MLGDDIQKRVANKVYNDCRSGTLQIASFPQFDGLLKSLKEGCSTATSRSYSVCTQQQSRLVILQSLASKFVDGEVTKDAAIEVINKHNAEYNADGSFWEEDERTDT